MVEEEGTGNVCPSAHFGTRKSCARAKCRSHPRSYRPPLAERNPESSLCRAPRSNPGGSLTKDTLKGDLPVLVEGGQTQANSFLRPFSRLTMPLKQLSRVYPAASEGSLARAAGDRAVERAGGSSTALFRICLLTGGDDRPYALGMACALSGQGISVDFIGSDQLDSPELHRSPLIAFLNLRGDQNEDAPLLRKVARILAYYARLASYVPRSQARIFHLLWNNKFEHFDRVAL